MGDLCGGYVGEWVAAGVMGEAETKAGAGVVEAGIEGSLA